MPLNYATREQVSGYRFLVHRLSVAVGRRSVRLIHDPTGAMSAALLGVLCPWLLRAGTGKWYVVPLVRPVMVAVLAPVVVAVLPPGLAVTV